MNVIGLRHGCFGRKWLAENGLLDGRDITAVRLPNSWSWRHIVSTYRRMRADGLHDFQARATVETLLAAALSPDDYHGLGAA